MMKHNIIEEKNKVILKDMLDFDPKHIFECGQAFRWTLEEDKSYTIIAFGKVLNIKREDNDIIFLGTNMEDFNNIWYVDEYPALRCFNMEDFENIWFRYFDLGRDYGLIKRELSKDSILEEAIRFGQGLRILNQEPFETIISFIISANNQIPRIKSSVDLIAKNYGNRINNIHYGFPKVEVLSKADPNDLRETCRVGYRDVMIVEASKMIFNEAINLNEIDKLSREDSKKFLMDLPGVGPKVADCILLFAFDKDDAFPVDRWVKRVMEHFYIQKDIKEKEIGAYGDKLFGSLSGYAQHYLFYYARALGIGK